jgi:hypothetical protein
LLSPVHNNGFINTANVNIGRLPATKNRRDGIRCQQRRHAQPVEPR